MRGASPLYYYALFKCHCEERIHPERIHRERSDEAISTSLARVGCLIVVKLSF